MRKTIVRGGMVLAFALLAITPEVTIAQPVRHVVVIGIDGMGAEGVARVDPPVLRRLREQGAWTLKGRAVIPTVSAPNWASMIMGAGPAQHGVTSNDWRADSFEIAPVCTGSEKIFPTIFGLLRQQRATAVIGIFHDWEGFGHLFERKAANVIVDAASPIDAIARAGEFMVARRPDLTFIHLDDVDHAGHNHGWLSPQYDAAIREADRMVGELIARLEKADLLKQTAILVTADHGGKGTKHGGLTMSEIEIPWILSAPGIRRGEITKPVNTYDTAATLARLLGINPPACWIGRSVID
ncbi:MAG: alkaline phosphatase family protein [Blastocatellia bacterium]